MAPKTVAEFQTELRKFCTEHKVSEFLEQLGTRDPVVLSEAMSPINGFQALADSDLRACPVRGEDNEIIGTLDLRDICKFMVEGGASPKGEEVRL